MMSRGEERTSSAARKKLTHVWMADGWQGKKRGGCGVSQAIIAEQDRNARGREQRTHVEAAGDAGTLEGLRLGELEGDCREGRAVSPAVPLMMLKCARRAPAQRRDLRCRAEAKRRTFSRR